jgi:hypothetical protein
LVAGSNPAAFLALFITIWALDDNSDIATDHFSVVEFSFRTLGKLDMELGLDPCVVAYTTPHVR